MAVPPVSMELPASQVVADRGVVPPEEYMVPKQVVSEPAGPEPTEPAPAVPECSFPEWPSPVQTSQQEVSIVKLQVVPWVGGPLEGTDSKWRGLEG